MIDVISLQQRRTWKNCRLSQIEEAGVRLWPKTTALALERRLWKGQRAEPLLEGNLTGKFIFQLLMKSQMKRTRASTF